MSKLLVLIFLFSIPSSWSVDFSKYKAKIRSHMAQMMGEETTAKIMGPARDSESSIQLPKIPEVKINATSTDVYNNKNREIDSQGESYGKLSTDEKRKYRVAFIQEVYQVTRNSEAKEADVLTFLNVLEQGGSREGIYRAVTLDSVYSSLESYEEVPEKAVIDFAMEYAEKYLGRVYDKSAMEKLNLWSIKRILVEKSLELIDVFGNQPEDLRAWYAVLSAELAKKKPQIWKNQVRANQNPEFHFRWAKKAPYQHIKSEVIVKLHQMMNSLNEVPK